MITKPKRVGRMRLWICACDPIIRLRAGHDDLRIMCCECETLFVQVDKSPTNKRRGKDT